MGNKSAATALGSHTDAAAGLASGATSPLIIATKLRAPTYAGDLVRREALLGRLNAARACRLVLLRAPAGYGKTTLAVQWRDALLAEGARVAWLSLDEDDNDPTRFLTYLIEALAGVHAVPGQDLLSALETHSHDVTRFVLGDLVNSVAEFAGDIFLICDDWHAIHEEGVQDALAFLLAHAPANFHLLVASRRQLPLALARLRVEGQVEEVEARDLRFDAAESRQFIQEINALGLPDEDLDRLWRTTDGWVAALQLASLSVRASGDPTAAIAAMTAFGGQRSIGEYLAENVIDQLPAQTLDFLLRTSILDRLCAPQCAAVSGYTDSQTILETLERQDLFIRPLDRERRWFRYHHLFAAYLQRRLERDHPLEVAALHRAACEWFAAEGHTDEAVGHALAAGAQDRAIELVERDSMFLVEHSRMATLLGLVRRLPARRLMDRPKLQMAIAWSHCLTHHPDGVRHALDRLKAALADRAQEPQAPDCNELHAEANLVRGATDIYADCIEGVEALVKPCLDYPDTHRPWVVAVAANVLSYVLIHGFEFDRARALQTWARPFHDRTQGPFSGVYGRCFAGMAAAQQGELDSAGAHFQDALELARGTAGGHSHAARLAGALWGQIQYEYNELALAERLLEESRALGAGGGVADFSLATYIPLTRLRAAAADTAGAHALLDEGVETARELGFERLAAAVDGDPATAVPAAGV
ncbi:MAG: hypothetical protein L0H83_13790 [Salinisphaera sp.]|nr:hypothetical protein [Salinisphaera sp.]